MVSRRGGADDADSSVEGELTEYGSDATVRTVDQDRLARLNAGFAIEHLPGSDAVDHHGLDELGIQRWRDRHEILGRHDHVTGPSARFGDGRHSLSEQILLNAATHGEHPADEVISRHKWKGWLSGIPAPSHRLFGERDARRLDLHEHFMGTGREQPALPNLQAGRLDSARKDNFGRQNRMRYLRGDHPHTPARVRFY
jgi:hypothetical protein